MKRILLTIALILGLAANAWAVAPYIQDVGSPGTSSSSFTQAITVANSAALLVCGTTFTGTPGTTGFSDNNGGSWTEVTGFPLNINSTNQYLDVWYAPNHASGATTITGTTSINREYGIDCAEYYPMATTSVVDTQTTYSPGTGLTSALSGTIDTSNASDLLVCFGGYAQASSDEFTGVMSDYGFSAGPVTALTNRLNPPSGQNSWGIGGYQPTTATGNYACQFNMNFSASAGAGIVAFKQATGPTPTATATPTATPTPNGISIK